MCSNLPYARGTQPGVEASGPPLVLRRHVDVAGSRDRGVGGYADGQYWPIKFGPPILPAWLAPVSSQMLEALVAGVTVVVFGEWVRTQRAILHTGNQAGVYALTNATSGQPALQALASYLQALTETTASLTL